MSADSRAPLDPRPAHVRPVALSVLADLLGVARPRTGVDVSGVSLRSQEVRHADLYAALPGASTHGARFAAEAVAGGATAILTDPEGRDLVRGAGPPVGELPVLVVVDPRSRLGDVAARVYDHPAERLTTVGITGTQGKTTCTYLAESALRAAGANPGVVGTIGTRIAGREVASALTTPEAPQLHALFGVMVDNGVDACAMEVSSHALVKGRVDGVVFDVATFLNLGRDHLDFHADMEDYFDAKARLFEPGHARHAVVNVDDAHGRRLLARTALPATTFSATGAPADWRVVESDAGPLGSTVRVAGPDRVELDVRIPLAGDFNVANALAVISALATAGYDPVDLAAGIASCPGVPGRMERVEEGQEFTALVDYAHKPDALEAVLGALRPVTRGRIVLVVGAGGDRDTGKRPIMGQVAARWCDVVVVTDDNPRTEDPAEIRAEVLAGARAAARPGTELVEVAGRRDAIGYAVDLARAGDVVVVAGKGHERGQVVNGIVHPFDDRDVLRSAIAARGGAGAR
ncbi:MAG: UDP-N-acetylmuramoyl-L-alanyl-D-glutamate--2,6-diaminopimelate ligase [Nocardioidaceae bacterium]